MASFVSQLNSKTANRSGSRSRSRNNPLKTSFGQNQNQGPLPLPLIGANTNTQGVPIKNMNHMNNMNNNSVAYSEMTDGISVLDQTVKHDFQQESRVEEVYTPRRHFGATPLQQSFRKGAREESVQRQKEKSIQKSIATRNMRDRSSSQNSTLSSRNTELNFQGHTFRSPQRTLNTMNQNHSIRQPTVKENIPNRNNANHPHSVSQSFLNNNSSIISIKAKRRFEEPKRAKKGHQQEEQSFSRVISHQDSQYIELDFNKPQKKTSFGDSQFEDFEPKVNLENILDLAANEEQRLNDSLSVISQQEKLRERVHQSQRLNSASRLVAGKNLSFLNKDHQNHHNQSYNYMLNSTFAENPEDISLPFLFFDVVKGYFQNLCYSIRRVLLSMGNKIDQQRNLMALEDDIGGDEMAYNEITSNIRQNDILNIVVFLLVCILVITFYNR